MHNIVCNFENTRIAWGTRQSRSDGYCSVIKITYNGFTSRLGIKFNIEGMCGLGTDEPTMLPLHLADGFKTGQYEYICTKIFTQELSITNDEQY